MRTAVARTANTNSSMTITKLFRNDPWDRRQLDRSRF